MILESVFSRLATPMQEPAQVCLDARKPGHLDIPKRCPSGRRFVSKLIFAARTAFASRSCWTPDLRGSGLPDVYDAPARDAITRF